MNYSIIIANYNGKHLLDTCLSSLVPQVDDVSNIILVDNGSVDGSVDYMKKKWPCVTTLPLESNTGFTGANNAGAALSDSDIIILLNTDTRVAPGWLNNLLSPFSDPSVGAVTSSMRRMGNIQVMDSAGGFLDSLSYSFDRGRGDSFLKWREHDEVLFPCGGAMALRRDALDEKHVIFWSVLFLYNEDTDLGLRLWKNGYRVVYQPDAVVEHIFSATTGENSPVKMYYCGRNRILVMKRHLGQDFSQISGLIAFWEVLALGFMLTRIQLPRFKASIRGSREGFNTSVVPYGDPQKTRELYRKFMQPTAGSYIRSKLGTSVLNRL